MDDSSEQQPTLDKVDEQIQKYIKFLQKLKRFGKPGKILAAIICAIVSTIPIIYLLERIKIIGKINISVDWLSNIIGLITSHSVILTFIFMATLISILFYKISCKKIEYKIQKYKIQQEQETQKELMKNFNEIHYEEENVIGLSIKNENGEFKIFIEKSEN